MRGVCSSREVRYVRGSGCKVRGVRGMCCDMQSKADSSHSWHFAALRPPCPAPGSQLPAESPKDQHALVSTAMLALSDIAIDITARQPKWHEACRAADSLSPLCLTKGEVLVTPLSAMSRHHYEQVADPEFLGMLLSNRVTVQHAVSCARSNLFATDVCDVLKTGREQGIQDCPFAMCHSM